MLVVDDNDGFRESLVFLLSGEDLEVIGQARSGEEAIELVRRLAPDVVLMDIRMPEMDGIEATRRLKAARPSVGVIALSSMEEQRSIRDMLVAGATGYVLKGSDSDAIVHAVREAVSGGAMLSPEVTPVVIEEMTDALDRERRRARQLEIAQEALLERAAHRQQLIGRVGHELRTPVTVILGIAQTMQRGQMPQSELDEALQVLVERAEGLARLVQRFEAVIDDVAERVLAGFRFGQLTFGPALLDTLFDELPLHLGTCIDHELEDALASGFDLGVIDRTEPLHQIFASQRRHR